MPTPNSSFSGVIIPRMMFLSILSISSTRITRPRTHIGSLHPRLMPRCSLAAGVASGPDGSSGAGDATSGVTP